MVESHQAAVNARNRDGYAITAAEPAATTRVRNWR
jgi:hypothetical protein